MSLKTLGILIGLFILFVISIPFIEISRNKKYLEPYPETRYEALKSMNMKKVIFLDIDGVICVDWREYVDEYGHGFRKEFVGNLKHIIDQTGAKIVLSSTWRMEGMSKMKAMWEFRDLPGELIGDTPLLNTIRGEEIAEYLRENPCDRYVIIDDCKDFLPEQKEFFVRTAFNQHEDSFKGLGLTKACAEKAIEILNKN